MKKLLLASALITCLGASVAHAEEAAPSAGPDKMMDNMLSKDDLNGDGMVSKEEYLKAAEARFGKIDTNGDGNLNKEEAQAFHEKRKEKWKAIKDRRNHTAE